MPRPMFIDLTEVRYGSIQSYITVNIDCIDLIEPGACTIDTLDGLTRELTEESMDKLLHVLEDNGMIIGAGYMAPKKKEGEDQCSQK